MMPTVKRFEELEIWRIARDQCDALYRAGRDTDLRKDFELWNQINASSGSVMDNIAEGFDRFTRAEFKQFLIIARGSNAETRSQLYRIRDRGYFNEAYCDSLIQTCTNLSVKITNLVNHILRSDYTQKPIAPAPGDVSEEANEYRHPDQMTLPIEFLVQVEFQEDV